MIDMIRSVTNPVSTSQKKFQIQILKYIFKSTQKIKQNNQLNFTINQLIKTKTDQY